MHGILGGHAEMVHEAAHFAHHHGTGEFLFSNATKMKKKKNVCVYLLPLIYGLIY
jgi:hypothetical protein